MIGCHDIWFSQKDSKRHKQSKSQIFQVELIGLSLVPAHSSLPCVAPEGQLYQKVPCRSAHDKTRDRVLNRSYYEARVETANSNIKAWGLRKPSARSCCAVTTVGYPLISQVYFQALPEGGLSCHADQFYLHPGHRLLQYPWDTVPVLL